MMCRVNHIFYVSFLQIYQLKMLQCEEELHTIKIGLNSYYGQYSFIEYHGTIIRSKLMFSL